MILIYESLSTTGNQLFDGNEAFLSSGGLTVSELRKPIQLICKNSFEAMKEMH